MESKPLFISYSHNDKKDMLAIKQALLDAGLDVWTDENLKPGTQIWADSIEKAIRNSAAVVLILTPNAVDAKWVKRELMFADGLGVKIFPVHVIGSDDETRMLAISTMQKTILREYFDKKFKNKEDSSIKRSFEKDPKWEALVSNLKAFGSEPITRPRSPEKSKNLWLWSIGVVLVGVITLWFTGLVPEAIASFAPTPTQTNLPTLTSKSTKLPSETPTNEITPTDLPTEIPSVTPTATITPTPIPQGGQLFTNPKDNSPYAFIPAGSFLMGSDYGEENERPVHEVYLDEYLIGQTEVTNAMYSLCVSSGECDEPQNGNFGDSRYSNYPIVFISWTDAFNYCKWAGGRLPTEAQWEKAARGGLVQKSFPWGDENPSCLDVITGANFGGCGEGKSVVVGSYEPNGYQIFDMAGNVWEWVNDIYSDEFYSLEDLANSNPIGPDSASQLRRVIRGGSWDPVEENKSTFYLRVSNRGANFPTATNSNTGFRCVISYTTIISP